jgi:hypothetical protein
LFLQKKSPATTGGFLTGQRAFAVPFAAADFIPKLSSFEK